jgi:hypothetical protein
VFIFLGFQSKLNEGLDGTGSVKYPFSLSLLGGITCMITSVISGFGLKKHLLEWDDDDDDEWMNETKMWHREPAVTANSESLEKMWINVSILRH